MASPASTSLAGEWWEDYFENPPTRAQFNHMRVYMEGEIRQEARDGMRREIDAQRAHMWAEREKEIHRLREQIQMGRAHHSEKAVQANLKPETREAGTQTDVAAMET